MAPPSTIPGLPETLRLASGVVAPTPPIRPTDPTVSVSVSAWAPSTLPLMMMLPSLAVMAVSPASWTVPAEKLSKA